MPPRRRKEVADVVRAPIAKVDEPHALSTCACLSLRGFERAVPMAGGWSSAQEEEVSKPMAKSIVKMKVKLMPMARLTIAFSCRLAAVPSKNQSPSDDACVVAGSDGRRRRSVDDVSATQRFRLPRRAKGSA